MFDKEFAIQEDIPSFNSLQEEDKELNPEPNGLSFQLFSYKYNESPINISNLPQYTFNPSTFSSAASDWNAEVSITVVVQESRIYSGCITDPDPVQINITINSEDNFITMKQLVSGIKDKISIIFDNKQISYKIAQDGSYELAGIFPEEKCTNTCIPLTTDQPVIYLKMREVQKEDKVDFVAVKKIRTKRRGNESVIGEAIDKVKQWRELYASGRVGNDGAVERISLEAAAKTVNVPLKTLRYYHKEILKGKSLGFNFGLYYQYNMSRLYKYNKEKDAQSA